MADLTIKIDNTLLRFDLGQIANQIEYWPETRRRLFERGWIHLQKNVAELASAEFENGVVRTDFSDDFRDFCRQQGLLI